MPIEIREDELLLEDLPTDDKSPEVEDEGGTEDEPEAGDEAGTDNGNPAQSQTPADPADELAILRAELEGLRSRLDEQNRYFERMSREIAEFTEVFPGEELGSLPGEVWESVRSGVPLAAAYAYDRARRKRAAEINVKNSENSSGCLDGRGKTGFFTPNEVRSMSASEVRENYTKIIDSMKSWS